MDTCSVAAVAPLTSQAAPFTHSADCNTAYASQAGRGRLQQGSRWVELLACECSHSCCMWGTGTPSRRIAPLCMP